MPRKFEIVREIELPADPERVWDAVATPEGLSSWFGEQPVVPEGATATVWEPPHRLKIDLPAGPGGITHAFEYEITSRSGGRTTLRFVHSGFLGEDWEADFDYGEATGQGWDMYLHTLAEYLTHFRGRHAVYVVAEAPRNSAGEGAWQTLVDALGVAPGVQAGDPVVLAADGLPPTAGVADYVATGFFLGVRTEDSMVRFHVRGGIGLPVAIGVHLFNPGAAPAEKALGAWTSWLERAFA